MSGNPGGLPRLAALTEIAR